MRLSRKCDYALRSLVEMAVRDEGGYTSVAELAAAASIPVSFLEQIFITLRNAGLLAAKAGPGGGYKLRRRPSEISLIEIVRLIDGPIAPVRCVSHTAHEECPHEESCPLRPIMSDVRDAIAKILEPLTLEDACRRAGALRAER